MILAPREDIKRIKIIPFEDLKAHTAIYRIIEIKNRDKKIKKMSCVIENNTDTDLEKGLVYEVDIHIKDNSMFDQMISIYRIN